jgi:hypothetical protein
MWHFNVLKAVSYATRASIKLATILTLPMTAAITSGGNSTAVINDSFG